MSQEPDGPVYLTARGRRRLEERVAQYTAQVGAWRSSEADEPRADDRGDAAERLIEADDLTAARDFLTETVAVLGRAVAMPEGPDDGIVRLGSTVTVRENGAADSTWLVVDPAEFEDGETQ